MFWPGSGLSLDPQPGALSLLCHLISLALHKGGRGGGHMGPIWSAIKSARAQHALLREYLHACCTKVSDFEDEKRRKKGHRSKKRKKMK